MKSERSSVLKGEKKNRDTKDVRKLTLAVLLAGNKLAHTVEDPTR